MNFEDLIRAAPPPPNRFEKCDGAYEHHFDEGAIMVAFAMHLLRTTEAQEVRIHPDGEHGKRFDFSLWLGRQGFHKTLATGTTTYGGVYERADKRRIVINPKSGVKDVVAEVDGAVISAECKGGIVNTRHAGQVSRLDKDLCEAIGRLMASEEGGRQIAVVPRTPQTERLAARLAPRCAKVGIEIALVGSNGEITDCRQARRDGVTPCE